MISENQQRIYNNHLVVSRKAKWEPYTIRKNFAKFDEEKIPYLAKLDRFFTSYPTIDQEDFFIAPHKVYPEPAEYKLVFYTGQKAVSCYAQYMKMLEVQDPDSQKSLERLQQSLKFIFNFCKEKGLTLEQYELNIEETIPSFVKHLKEHEINYYALHALSFSAPKLDSRIIDFIFSDFYGTFQKTKNKYYASSKMREFTKQAKIKIQDKLNELL